MGNVYKKCMFEVMPHVMSSLHSMLRAPIACCATFCPLSGVMISGTYSPLLSLLPSGCFAQFADGRSASIRPSVFCRASEQQMLAIWASIKE